MNVTSSVADLHPEKAAVKRLPGIQARCRLNADTEK